MHKEENMKNSVQALLSCFPIAELYKSRSQTNLFECFDSEYRTFSSEIKGCALRVYNKTQTEGKMYIKHGTLSIDDYFVNTIENTIPYMLLPQKKLKLLQTMTLIENIKLVSKRYCPCIVISKLR